MTFYRPSAFKFLLLLASLVGFSEVYAQGLLFTPPGITFTNTAPGSMSNVETVTVTFQGPPPPLDVTAIEPPTNPAFTVTNNSCGAGPFQLFATCTISFTFTAPVTAGLVSDSFVFQTALFGPQSISLTGNSVGAPPLTPQAISFTSTAPADAAVGGATYGVTATGGGSSNPVVFSIDPSAASICSISGSTVSFLAPGTCVVNADQAGDASYEPAPQAQQSFAVSPAPLTPQSITFTSTPPSSTAVGGTYEVAATGGTSGEPVMFSIDPSASAICSIIGSTVSFLSEGNCVINANQAGNTTHEPAAQAAQSFSISPATVTPSAATPVPTLNQWGLMLLASLLGGLTFWRQRRKS